MSNLRRDFTQGKMDLDTEGRLLQPGVYRRGDNILVVNSESSDVGSIQKSFSNKQLTNINFGGNAECLLGLNDEYEKKLYWFVKSNNGCYLIEWDDINQTYMIVLEDTRPVGSRVLDLDSNHLITGIFKIVNDDPSKNLFCWTDDNIEPCCINLARAKTYGANNFDKEDIYLIKKPPVNSPGILPLNIPGVTNNKSERFFSFSYRYKYLDGEYSALSTYANYDFNPKAFDLNFYTLDNKGMINAFNAAKISFDTGDKRVTHIQLVFKESNSNALFLIETFNKANLGWGDSQTKDYVFSNNKSYTNLPEDELYRAFDNVPLKAKALTYIGNRAVFGNYVEGRDIVDENGVKIVPDYLVSMTNELLDSGSDMTLAYPSGNQMQVTNPGNLPLNQGMKLVFYINLLLDGSSTYENSFYFILPQDYATLADVFASLDFDAFLQIIDADIKINFQYDSPDGWNIDVEPSFTYTLVAGIPTFTVTPVTFIDTTDGDAPHTLNFSFINNSYVTLVVSANATSCKSNRDYEVGIVYEDDPCRKTTVITALYNTIHIPQLYSTFKNKLRITLNSPPPFWAKRFRLVVKAQPLQYQIIYINRFYSEDFYVWAKLEAENKDKVKVGENLVVKKGPDPLATPVKVKVLEIKEHLKDFITGNIDLDGNPIIEEAGLYMKIRPEGFSMDFDNFKINSGEAHGSSSNTPVCYLDLFTDLAGPTELSLPQGSSIGLYFDSTFHWDSGWRHNVYDVTHYAQRNYTDIEEWFNENIIGRSLFIINSVNVTRDYGPQLSLVRGTVTNTVLGQSFSANPSGKLYLKVRGLESGGSGGRKGRVDAKIVVRSSSGFYVFETEPKQADNKIFYETPQTFEITNGNHEGNVQDQNLGALAPAIIDLDFFNCYAQGNGVESYRIRDGFNTNALNIDLRPSLAMIEEYKSIRRKSSLTYGDKFIESTNTNRLNEFNLSSANFKDLDKQYGSIQLLLARDNDIVVFQEEKTSKVLFEKNAVTQADGSETLVSSDVVLGEQRTYLGENGIGTAPESAAVNDFQIYFTNARRGIVQRLSIDGIEDIVNGMVDFFRDLFLSRPNAKKLGGYDPYHKQYFLSVGEEPVRLYAVGCGAVINQYNIAVPFTYQLNLNSLQGDIVLNYDITQGNATITVTFDGDVYPESNVSGPGTITIPRPDTSVRTATVTITPIGGPTSFIITNVCPLGIPMTLVSIVLNGLEDDAKTMTTRYRWGLSPYYSDTALFTPDYVSRFDVEQGIEGQGKFPERGSVVRIETNKDISNTGDFTTEQCNRIGYLITDQVYVEADIDTIKAAAIWLSLSQFDDSNYGNFLFSKVADDEILYLIWDFEDKKPILTDDTISVLEGTSVTINMLGNDIVSDDAVVEIISGPDFGDVVINEDKTITYSNTSSTTEDVVVYSVTQNGCTATATIIFSVYTEETAPTLFLYHASRGNVTTFECGDNFDVFNPRTIYVDVQPYSTPDWFILITQVFSNEAGTIPAPDGWYLDSILSIGMGVHYLHWNGTEVTETGYCEAEDID